MQPFLGILTPTLFLLVQITNGFHAFICCSSGCDVYFTQLLFDWAMGDMRNAYKILIRKPEGRIPLRRPKQRWENNVTMDLREIRSWYSSISIVTRLRARRQECFSSPPRLHRLWGPPMGTGTLSPGVKRPRREAHL
jgi:hypothetical protein